MLGNPFSYNEENTSFSQVSPSVTHTANAMTTRFFERLLMKRAMNMIITPIPDSWDMGYYKTSLFYFGFAAVTNTNKFGIIPQACTLGGFNVFYEPATATISNPLIEEDKSQMQIGRDCEIVKIFPDFTGVYDIVSLYANRLSLTEETLATNIQNSKLAYLFIGENNQDVESFKKLYDQIQAGQPAAFTAKDFRTPDGKEKITFLSNNLQANYIADKLNDSMQNYMHDFDSIMGIPNVSEKRERLLTNEVDKNNVESQVLIDLIIETYNKSVDDVLKLYPRLSAQGLGHATKRYGNATDIADTTKEGGDTE